MPLLNTAAAVRLGALAVNKIMLAMQQVWPAWSPLSFFPAGEPGVWLHPGDFTRYMAELGPEILAAADSDFSSDTGYWTKEAGITISDGAANWTASTNTQLYRNDVTVAGEYYTVTIVIASISGSVRLETNTYIGTWVSAPGTHVFSFQATGGKISIKAYGTITASIDTLSIKALTAIRTFSMAQFYSGYSPVTAMEQVVGLMLDQRFGLIRDAQEIVSDTEFDDTTKWTKGAGWTVANGVATGSAVPNGSFVQLAVRPTVFVVGASYEYKIVVDSLTAGSSFALQACGVVAPSFNTVGVTYGVITAATVGGLLGIRATSAGATGVIASLSIRKLPGAHAIQTTSAARPLLSARKNLFVSTESLIGSYWTKTGCTVVEGTSTTLATTTSGAISYLERVVAVNLLGDPRTLSLTVRAGTVDTCAVGMYSTGALWGAEIDTSGRIISGPGTATRVSGSLFDIAGLSTTEDTVVEIVHRNNDDNNTTFNFYVRGNVAANNLAGDSVVVTKLQLERGSAATRYQLMVINTEYNNAGFLHYVKLDGIDDGFGTNTFAAGTLTNNMDCFMLVRRDATTQAVIMYGQSSAEVAAYVLSADGAACYGNAGTPTYVVNGIAVAATRAALNAALTAGPWHVLEIRNLNLSTWTALKFGNLVGNRLNGAFAEIILGPAQTAAKRTDARQYLAAKAGIVLP